MSAYAWGWLVVGGSALLLVVALGRMLRDWQAPLVKHLVGWCLLAVAVAPAQIPRHTDELAPAIVVFFFESFLQRDGSPDAAGRILLAAGALGLVLGLAWHGLARLLGRRTVA